MTAYTDVWYTPGEMRGSVPVEGLTVAEVFEVDSAGLGYIAPARSAAGWLVLHADSTRRDTLGYVDQRHVWHPKESETQRPFTVRAGHGDWIPLGGAVPVYARPRAEDGALERFSSEFSRHSRSGGSSLGRPRR